MKELHYIAYGSNLNISQMELRCPNAEIVGTALVENYRLLFKGSKTGSYLTIEPKQGSCVPVAVWSISADDEARLDLYEGYPDFYYKSEFKLNVTNIRPHLVEGMDAFAYIMNENRNIGIPSRSYLQTCVEGYRNFGFDITYLTNAYLYSKEAAICATE